jgi:hypothetical protein
MTSALQTGRYATGRGEEQFLRFLPKNDIHIILIEPFFEERNFLRRTIVTLARSLARRDIGSLIPDLPGCGESMLDIGDVTFADWESAIGDVSNFLTDETGRKPHIASMRGGALLDRAADGASWWRFAPATGADILRPMHRAQQLSGAEGEALAGYAIPPAMIREIERAVPEPPTGPLRECAVTTPGTPLWRRAEPGEDLALVEAMADDLADWVKTCAAA